MKQTRIPPNQNAGFSVKQLAASGLVIAAYLVLMYLTQSISFGQYQMRVATALYALAAIHPFLILPLGLANLLSNLLFGGLGPFDMLGGFAVGVLTAAACVPARKAGLWLVALPILLIPSLLVPVWLSFLLRVPYPALVLSVGAGQTLPAVLGVILVRYLERPLTAAGEGRV